MYMHTVCIMYNIYYTIYLHVASKGGIPHSAHVVYLTLRERVRAVLIVGAVLARLHPVLAYINITMRLLCYCVMVRLMNRYDAQE